ncbi:hypothetical protein [Curtobacterium sp. MCSS17_007]|uniref:hypothetical protein n=1 Tax=Curtobacterium sp. MCSS17_007 TaxID=2175646 RepID=UPI000DA93597|nr:hypothetical protein [Curtobacterium sp. MCSS17_007]WIE76069.1 hypothetical protein DEJ22_002050 [Curtobacterium sp. MCSS17_007]
MSLTSYGVRLERVHLVIESIGRGSLRPSRVVLWLGPQVDPEALPRRLKRLCGRGLQIRSSPWDIRSHNKYFPMVHFEDPVGPLVTADDDVFYPRWWLRRLVDAAAESPDDVVGHRVRLVKVDRDGSPAPYEGWHLTTSTEGRTRHFATGSAGALYPVAVQEALRASGRSFIDRCPTADDIWLHHVTLLSGSKVRQVGPRARTFLEVPGTQSTALNHDNTAAGGNDRQVASTYDAHTLDLIRSDVP